MYDIESIISMCSGRAVELTQHFHNRIKERCIKYADVINAIRSGEIIEQNLDDFPNPSILILGKARDGKPLHIAVGVGEVRRPVARVDGEHPAYARIFVAYTRLPAAAVHPPVIQFAFVDVVYPKNTLRPGQVVHKPAFFIHVHRDDPFAYRQGEEDFKLPVG